MRVKLGEVEVEGTHEEVQAALRELRALGVLPTAGVQTTFTTTQPQVTILEPAAPHPTRTDGVTRPHNEALLYEYRNDTGVSKNTRRTRVSIAEDFERMIAPKSLLEVDAGDVRAYERRLTENCKSLNHTSLKGSPGVVRVRCGLGVYDWTTAKPPSCCAACPQFARQREGPAARLGHLKAFYDWLLERGLIQSNPVELVKRRHLKSRGPNKRAPKKYAPTLDEARELVAAARRVCSPFAVALLLCLIKWGRRSGHTVLLRACDLVNLDEAGPAWVSFEHVKEVVEQRNESTWTKLNGNLYSPVDNELRVYLRDVYLPWREATWGYTPGDENALFPGEVSGKPLDDVLVQGHVLDPAMRELVKRARTPAERARWEAHLKPRSKTRISPGCWRHFFTTQQKLAGVENDDIDYLRGDIVAASRWHYMHLNEDDVRHIYRMPNVLAEDDA